MKGEFHSMPKDTKNRNWTPSILKEAFNKEISWYTKKTLKYINISSSMEDLFQSAKNKDEFEYASTLLRIRGEEDFGWDTLVESHTLIKQLLAIASTPLVSHLQQRIFLMIYCHAVEINDLYNIIGNMLRVADGNRFSINCFIGCLHSSNKLAKYPEEKNKENL